MRWFAALLTVVVFLGPGFAPAPAGAAGIPMTTRISVASAGTQANGASLRPSISAGGRYVAFQSWASNLVDGDTNNAWDIFLRDRLSGTTTRVSVASDGSQANGSSYSPSISADGRYIAFQSDATNLTGGNTNGHSDILLHDNQSGTTSLVSLGHDGSPANGDSSEPALSADGHYVAFTSFASNLVIGDSNTVSDVFVRDVASGDIFIASANAANDPGSRGSSGPSISDDGHLIAFTSQTTTRGPGMDQPYVFLHNLRDRSTTMISVTNEGAPAFGASYSASMSGDGEYVDFYSSGLTYVPSGASVGVYLRNLRTNITIFVVPHGMRSVLNTDGRYVVFAAERNLLHPDDHSLISDIYRCDRQTGDIERVSANDQGVPGNGDSGTYQLGPNDRVAAVSGTGEFVAFTSAASNLVPGDSNNDWDIFVKDLGPVAPERGPQIPAFTKLSPSPFTRVAPGPTTISATVSSDSPPGEIDMLLDGTPVTPAVVPGAGPTFDISTTVNLTAGVHTVTATASDADRDQFQAQWDVVAGQPGESEWFSAGGVVKADQLSATLRSLVEAFRWHLYGQSWDGANHPELPTHVGFSGSGAPLEDWASNGKTDQSTTEATLRSLVEAFRWHYWGISWDGQDHPEMPTHASVVLPPQPIDPWFTASGEPIPANIEATLRRLVESFRWHFWGYSWDGRHHPEVPTHAG